MDASTVLASSEDVTLPVTPVPMPGSRQDPKPQPAPLDPAAPLDPVDPRGTAAPELPPTDPTGRDVRVKPPRRRSALSFLLAGLAVLAVLLVLG